MPGDQLAILLRSSSTHWYLWTTGYLSSDQYPGGSALQCGYPNYAEWIVRDNWDSGFRTWVVVPEPATLLPIALLLLGVHHRRCQ